MTRAQIEAGDGRYTSGRTTIIQRGDEDVFETHPARDGWVTRQGWHVAGSAGKTGAVSWCDLREPENLRTGLATAPPAR